MCGAFETKFPVSSKMAHEKSKRSRMLVLFAVRASARPICSAIDTNRLLRGSPAGPGRDFRTPFVTRSLRCRFRAGSVDPRRPGARLRLRPAQSLVRRRWPSCRSTTTAGPSIARAQSGGRLARRPERRPRTLRRRTVASCPAAATTGSSFRWRDSMGRHRVARSWSPTWAATISIGFSGSGVPEEALVLPLERCARASSDDGATDELPSPCRDTCRSTLSSDTLNGVSVESFVEQRLLRSSG